MWSVLVWFGLGGNGESILTELVVELCSVEWRFLNLRFEFYFLFPSFSWQKERRVSSVRAVALSVEDGGIRGPM